MKKQVIALIAVGVIAFAGCASDESDKSGQSMERPEAGAETVSSGEDDKTLAACRILAGNDNSILNTFPALLTEMPETIDDSNIGPYLSAYWSFDGAREKAPAEMIPHIDKLNAPFKSIYEASRGIGSGVIEEDTSGAMETVTEILKQCVDAGFRIEN